MFYKKLILIVMACIILFGCEKLEDLLTTVSGKVYADNCKVVIAVKGESELLGYLEDIKGIDNLSLRDDDLFRGFDLVVDEDSLYSITMLSFGETYFLAVIDDGEIPDELDTLDHVGFYGKSDTLIRIPYSNSDTTLLYSYPEKAYIENGTDESGIDIKEFIELRFFINIYESINSNE
ncbi:MAG: hypothetical protein P8Z50_01630 [candidate division WOR-3 bacterium]|jgi:hypothetical protein